MATIVSDAHKFIYMHIPKCAGTTLSTALKKAMPHDPQFLGGIPNKDTGEIPYLQHPVLGRLNAPHIPLALLRDHFPDTYAKFDSYAVYAITRDPQARFRSAVGQHAKEFLKKNLLAMPRGQVARVVKDCMAALTANPVNPGLAYMHLIRQSDFTELDGARLATDVYPIEAVDQMVTDIETRFGVDLNVADRKNQAKVSEFAGAGAALWWLGKAARSTLPEKTYLKVKNRAARLIGKSNPPKPDQSFFDTPEVTDFVSSFYARDFEIHTETQKRFAAGFTGADRPNKEIQHAH